MKSCLDKVIVCLWMGLVFLPMCVQAAAEHVHSLQLDYNRRLLHAADNNDVGTVHTVLRMKADIDTRNNKGFTPLMFAAQKGYDYVVATLVQNKADINAESDAKETPLWLAISQKHTNVAALLVDGGANMNNAREYVENGRGVVRQDALLQATESGDSNLVRMLLEKKANVNKQNELGCRETALMVAIKNINKDIVFELLLAGADETLKDVAGRTADDYLRFWERMQKSDNLRLSMNVVRQNAAIKRASRGRWAFDHNAIIEVTPMTELSADDYASRAHIEGVDLSPAYKSKEEEQKNGDKDDDNKEEAISVAQVVAAAEEVRAIQCALAEAAKSFVCILAVHETQSKTGKEVGKAHKVMIIECPACTYHNQEQAQKCDMCNTYLFE